MRRECGSSRVGGPAADCSRQVVKVRSFMLCSLHSCACIPDAKALPSRSDVILRYSEAVVRSKHILGKSRCRNILRRAAEKMKMVKETEEKLARAMEEMTKKGDTEAKEGAAKRQRREVRCIRCFRSGDWNICKS